jgi:hypothetical protein
MIPLVIAATAIHSSTMVLTQSGTGTVRTCFPLPIRSAMTQGSYLTGILAFWYVRPFVLQPENDHNNLRFRLALLLTLFYNCPLLFVLSSYYLGRPINLPTSLDQFKKAALYLGFVVAPVNLYFFGTKASNTAEAGE